MSLQSDIEFFRRHQDIFQRFAISFPPHPSRGHDWFFCEGSCSMFLIRRWYSVYQQARTFTSWLRRRIGFRSGSLHGTGSESYLTADKQVSKPRVEWLESRSLPSLFGNALFPADNPWNQRITDAPVATNSDTLLANIGLMSHVHADFGAALWQGSLIGIPWNAVSGTQPKVNVVIDAYASESDVQPIPIPSNAIIEGDPLPASQNTGDRH